MNEKISDEDKKKYTNYLGYTDRVAVFSKDQSTKVGAICLNETETSPMSFGYNGMPRGLDDSNEERNQRPEKYFWYEHAERNMIYNIARNLLKDGIMFSTKHPNMEAARAVTSSGVKTIVIEYNSNIENSLSLEDKKMNERVNQLFLETGVQFIKINREEIEMGFSPYELENEIENELEHNLKNNTKDVSKKLEEFSLKEKYLKYLDLAKFHANTFSPDREEKTASMILNKETFEPIEDGFGVNSPPEVLPEITEEMHDPKEKQFWFQEAEKNAIFNAVRVKFKGKTAISGWCPCIHCSLGLVSVSAGKIVTRKPDFTKEADLRWKDSFDRGEKLFKMAGIPFILLDVPKPENVIVEKKKNKKKI